MKTEYRIDKIVTYQLLRFHSDGNMAGCDSIGLYEREEEAKEVREALEAKTDEN